MKLIIQIPCFNEENTLAMTIGDLPKVIPGIDSIEYLVIDDGSTDKTVEVAKKLGVHHILSLGSNRGLAAAFRQGIQFALFQGADIVVNTDGDNQYAGKDIEKLVKPILKNHADMVIGCRPIIKHPEFHPLKKILQLLGSWTLRVLSKTQVRDAASGFRAFSRETCERLFIHSRFSYCMESLIQASSLNLRIVSVDIDVNRKTRDSRLFKNHLEYIYKSGSTILAMFILYRPGFLFFCLGSLCMTIGLWIGCRFLYLKYWLQTYSLEHMYIPSLILVAIWGFCFFVSQFKDTKNIATTFTLTGTMLVLFLCGSIGVLNVGSKVIFILGCFLFLFYFSATIYAFYVKIFKKERPFQTNISLGTLIFIITSCIGFFLTRNVILFGWDEFFWSLFPKVLKHTNEFYVPTDAVLDTHVRYPPAIPLLQYFFFTFGDYKDNILYFANSLIPLSVLSLLIDLADRRKSLILLAIVGFAFLVTEFYGIPYISIIVDPILGVLFAAGLIIVTYSENISNSKILLRISPIIAILPLIKETGLILALIIVGGFSIQVFANVLIEKPFRKIKLLSSFLLLFISLLLPFITRAIWVSHLSHVHALAPYTAFNLNNVLESLFSPKTLRETLDRHNLFIAIISTKLGLRNHGSLLFWFLGCMLTFIVASIITYYPNTREIIKKFLVAGVVLCGLVFFLIIHLLWYNYIARAPDGQLVSYQRYLGTYVMGMGLWVLSALIVMSNKSKLTKKINFMVILVCIILLCSGTFISFCKSVIKPVTFAQQMPSWTAEQAITPFVSLVKKYTQTNDRIFVVYQNSNGLESMVFRHKIAPRKINYWYWSLGKQYSNDDVWTANCTPAELQELLFNNFLPTIDQKNIYLDFKKEVNPEVYKSHNPFYTYVLLANVDKQFWDQYGEMFKPSIKVAKNYILFKIGIDESGKMYFTPIKSSDLYRPASY